VLHREPEHGRRLTEDDRHRYTEIARFLVHIDTLSAGSILVLATLAEKFEGAGPSWLLAVSVFGFALTIIVSLLCYLATIGFMSHQEPSEGEINFASFSLITACIAFAIALSTLAVFAAFAVN
jgi:hypothetical protein